ncbi:MAG: TIM barrel protein, partial [Planctomycetota bacterium]
MFLSLARITAGRDLSWPEFVALAGDIGYGGVDIELDKVREDGAAATLDLLGEYKLKPAVCGLPVEFRQDDAVFNEGMKDLGEYARLAVEIGCPRMATWVLPAYETPARQMRKILKRRFTEIARVLADVGVRIGLEFISPWHFRQSGHVCNIWQMTDMLELCHECGDNVGLLLDSWHWHHDPDHSVQA